MSNINSFIPHFDYNASGEEDWLVSPIMDFRFFDEINLFFDVSYAYTQNIDNEGLKILVSTDCGQTYAHLVYEKYGKNLSVAEFSGSWTPDSEQDWRTDTISLKQFAGEKNVRIAFVTTNQFGNNMYIDNIQVLNTASIPVVPENSFSIYPNPFISSSGTDYSSIAFNLREKQDVSIALIDRMGRKLFENIYPETFNQIYPFHFIDLPSGVYFIRVVGDKGINITQRIVIL